MKIADALLLSDADFMQHLNYKCFDDLKQAILGFLRNLSGLDPKSERV
jgi:hypothetical protein